MRRPGLTIVLIVACVLMAVAQAPPQGSPEDIEKNLVLVDQPRSVPDNLKAGYEIITARDSIAMLSFLSSDLLEGRDTATQGYMLAAEYAASLFTIWGLEPAGDEPTPARGFGGMRSPGREEPPEPSYFQEIPFRDTSNVSGTITLDIRDGSMEKSRTFRSGLDFPMMTSAAETVSAPVVFGGYGIREEAANWNDFANLDIKGKIVLILSEAPGKDNPDSPFERNKELKDKYFPAGPAMRGPRMRDGGFDKVGEIGKLGPAAILEVQSTGNDDEIFMRLASPRQPSDERPITARRRRLSIASMEGRGRSENPLVINITRQIADAVLESSGRTIDDLQNAIDVKLAPASMELPGTSLTISATAETSLVKCVNVLALLEGSDPKLKEEVVVIGAHLDHLGRSGEYIYNGADDNGSGSIGVLNAARAFAVNPLKPKRSVLFALWTGEEKGLLGSRYYVANPPFPMSKTVMYFNMDMISRPYDEETFTRMGRMFQFPGGQEVLKKIRLKDFLTVNFTPGMDGIVREANQYVGLHLFLREATEGRRGGGSDHASFAPAKVPYVYTMAAMTSDYHQTGDSVEKVSGDLLAKASRLTYLVSFAAANK